MDKQKRLRYEDCEHKKQDMLASDCVNCHVSWCHARIDYLESQYCCNPFYDIFFSKRDKCWVAQSKHFNHVSAFGNTIEEAIEELAYVIEGILELENE